MAYCEHCQDQLLDLVYGLVEEPAQSELRAHVADCPACQTALAAAHTQQRLLARVARPVDVVPEFSMPGAVGEQATVPAAPALVPNPQRRFLRPWHAWAAAAALVLLAIAPWALYQRGQADYRNALTQAEDRLATTEALLKEVQPAAERKEAEFARQLEAQTVQVHVLGPAELDPAAASVAQVITRDVAGRPAAGEVSVRLLQGGDARVLHEATVPSAGNTQISLPAVGRAGAESVRLVVEARSGEAKAAIEQELAVRSPALAAHLVTSKALYQPGELLQFRALTLERYSLTPPAQPVMLRADLLDAAGKSVAHQDGVTDAAGIFAGQLPVTDSLTNGSYTLRIQGPGSAFSLRPQQAPIEIVRDAVPDLALDKDQYRPGDQVNLYYANPSGLTQNAKPKVVIDNQAVAANLGVAPLSAGAGGPPAAQRSIATQATNNLQTLQLRFALPQNLGGREYAEAKILLEEGKRKETLRQAIPVLPTQLAVDFFPEGGDLVAGLTSRVYYRVRAAQGTAAPVEGRLRLITRGGPIDSSYRDGLGFFEFVPDPKEEYRVSLTSPTGVTAVTQAFRAHPIRSAGLVMHVPAAVGKAGEAIDVTLRQRGTAQQVLLLVECRGRLVEEQWLDLADESTQVQLRPAAGASGLMRVTALAPEAGGWRPLAERLVYRAPAAGLQLDAHAPASPRPGQALQWNISARDEKGQPATAWVLAAVVDERYAPRVASPTSHFYLLGELAPGQNVEDALVLVSGANESPEQLDLVLGSHGWRRFVPAAVDFAQREARGETDLLSPSFFSRTSASLAELQRQVRSRVDAEVGRLRTQAAQSERDLREQRQLARAALTQARHLLEEYQERPRAYWQLGLAATFCLLIATGVILLGIGAVRVLGRRSSATSAFAASFACMMACLGLMVVGQTLVPEQRPAKELMTRAPNSDTAVAPAVESEDGKRGRVQERLAESPPSGSFTLATAARQQAGARGSNLGQLAAQPQAAHNFALNRAQMSHELTPRVALQSIEAARQRQVSDLAQRPASTTTPPSPTAPAANAPRAAPLAKDAAAGKKSAEMELHPFEGAATQLYRRSGALPMGTLLWRPSLFLEHGAAALSFEMPAAPGRYRVLLLGHDAAGRFGFRHDHLDTSAAGQR